jgi:acetyl esterase
LTDSSSMIPFVRPDTAAFLAFLNAQDGPKTHEVSPADARSMMLMMKLVADAQATPLATVRNLSCPGPHGDIPLRLYDKRENRAPGPVLVFYHGGGFVIGDIETHDPFCSYAADSLDIPVISVDYRMAPEHSWPASPQDCEVAARWIADNPAELGRQVTALTVGGDSAGGNLAIVTAMALRDDPAAVPVIAQLLIYPGTDMSTEYPSYNEFSEGYLLTRDLMKWFAAHYAADLDHPAASPALYSQAGMPRAVVVTASLDPIRDQGRLYASILAKDGVDVIFQEARGNIHGFICLRKAIPSSGGDIDRMLTAFAGLLTAATA